MPFCLYDFSPFLLFKLMGQSIDFHQLLDVAIVEARIGLSEGGIPIGSALFDEKGTLLGKGHNHRVQGNDATAHAEVEAFRNAGRRANYRDVILVTTLAPCWFCSGLIKQFGIQTVIVGESENFSGGMEWLRKEGVNIVELNSHECAQMLKDYTLTYPEIWSEDIGGEE